MEKIINNESVTREKDYRDLVVFLAIEFAKVEGMQALFNAPDTNDDKKTYCLQEVARLIKNVELFERAFSEEYKS